MLAGTSMEDASIAEPSGMRASRMNVALGIYTVG
jgi:hypothetical protein